MEMGLRERRRTMELGQFERMVEEMRGEKHLLLHAPWSLWEQWRFGLSVVYCEEGEIVAHVTLLALVEGWYELGNIWVERRYRGQGWGHRVMEEVLEKRDHIMLTSTNPIVWRMSEDQWLRRVLFVELPSEVWRATCVCSLEKRGHEDYRQCGLRDEPCRVYVK